SAVLERLHPGDFFGEWTLGRRASGGENLSVRARGNAVVAAMDADSGRRLLAQDSELALVLIDQLTARLDRCHHRIGDHFFLDVTAHLRRTLLQLASEPDAQHGSDGTVIRINRLELAATIGCSREMI